MVAVPELGCGAADVKLCNDVDAPGGTTGY